MADDEKRSRLSVAAPSDDIPAPLADAIRAGSVSAKILEHSHDADEAMKAFMGHQGEVIHIDEATNRRLLRKIDLNLMPVYAGKTPSTVAMTDCNAVAMCGLFVELSGFPPLPFLPLSPFPFTAPSRLCF